MAHRTAGARSRRGGRRRGATAVAAGMVAGLVAGVAGAGPAAAGAHLAALQDPAPPCTAGTGPAPFPDREDIPVVHRQAVGCLALYEVAQGAGGPVGPVFRPHADLTRGQMASFLARALVAAGHPLPEPSEDFADIAGSVHADAIRRLATLGVLLGRADGRFALQEPVRRDQAASILLRAAAAARGVDVATLLRESGPFADVAGSVHRTAVNGARELGLVTGVTATTYRPAALLTRAQMASVVARWMNLEAVPTTSCTNPGEDYSLWYPAAWQVNDGSVLATCSVFDPEEVEVPPASELPLSDEVVVAVLDVPFAQVLTPSDAQVEEEVGLTVDGRPAVRQELVSSGDGLVPPGVRWTRFLVDRDGTTLQAATYDVPGNAYEAARGALTRMVLSLDLTGAGLPPFLPPTVAVSRDGDAVDLDLVDVRASHHEHPGLGYDRVVLEFTGAGTVGWTAWWGDEAILDGSGQVVDVDGDAVLSLAVTGQVVPPEPPFQGIERVPGPGLPVMEVVTGSVFEAQLDAFVGTAVPAPYRVFRLGSPERLVVDVQGNAG